MIFPLHEFDSSENNALDGFAGFRMAGQWLGILVLLNLIMPGIGAAALGDGFVDVGWHRGLCFFTGLLFENDEARRSGRLLPQGRLPAIAGDRLAGQVSRRLPRDTVVHAVPSLSGGDLPCRARRGSG